jgi:hypothetical protein
MTETIWRRGDRVVHASRPEWGVGEVTGATSFREGGVDAQRLTIRFARAGTKTISTAVARLVPAGAVHAASPEAREAKPRSKAPAPTTAPEAGAIPDAGALAARLVRIPDDASDPFRPLTARLEAAADLYRFEDSGRALLDWAAAQTGLADPLSVFSRHDLEEAFERFSTLRDAHLRSLVQLARRDEPEALAGLGRKVPPRVRELLTRMLTGR